MALRRQDWAPDPARDDYRARSLQARQCVVARVGRRPASGINTKDYRFRSHYSNIATRSRRDPPPAPLVDLFLVQPMSEISRMGWERLLLQAPSIQRLATLRLFHHEAVAPTPGLRWSPC